MAQVSSPKFRWSIQMPRPKQPYCPTCLAEGKKRKKASGRSYCPQCMRARRNKPKEDHLPRGPKPRVRPDWVKCKTCRKPGPPTVATNKIGVCVSCLRKVEYSKAVRASVDPKKPQVLTKNCYSCGAPWRRTSFVVSEDGRKRGTYHCKACRKKMPEMLAELGVLHPGHWSSSKVTCVGCGEAKLIGEKPKRGQKSNFIGVRYWAGRGGPFCRDCVAEDKRLNEQARAKKIRETESLI